MTFVLAIDLGGTKVEAALVSGTGEVQPQSRVRHPTGRDIDPSELRAALHHVVTTALAAAADGADIVGVGIGAAGPFRSGGEEIAPVNMPGVRGFRLAAEVSTLVAGALGRAVPTRLGHDGSCLALAEAWLGATQGSHSSMSIVVSTGIGGGVVMYGVLLGGSSGNAGHLGQTHVLGEGVTLEEVAAGPGSVRWAQARGWVGETGEELARDARAGNDVARSAIVRSARAVGAGLADAATLLDLEVVAIGGGFSQAADDYIDLVQQALRDTAVLEYAQQTRVVRSGLRGEGPLIGAAAVALRAAGELA